MIIQTHFQVSQEDDPNQTTSFEVDAYNSCNNKQTSKNSSDNCAKHESAEISCSFFSSELMEFNNQYSNSTTACLHWRWKIETGY